MKTYAELTHVDRGEPCVEYPGEWLVYGRLSEPCAEYPGEWLVRGESYSNKHAALATAALYAERSGEEIDVCWKASENDPRIGEVWFTGFYRVATVKVS